MHSAPVYAKALSLTPKYLKSLKKLIDTNTPAYLTPPHVAKSILTLMLGQMSKIICPSKPFQPSLIT